MEALIRSIGAREPMQRDTLYRKVAEERRAASLIAADLAPIVNAAAQEGGRWLERDVSAARRGLDKKSRKQTSTQKWSGPWARSPHAALRPGQEKKKSNLTSSSN